MLADRDVILFYKDGDTEKMVIATTKTPPEEGTFPELPDTFPVFKFEVAREMKEETRHIAFYSMPSREVVTIHVDDIIKFVVSINGLQELTREVLISGQD